jgi:hypothetical protein
VTEPTLKEAAQAVLDRWDSPQWEWVRHSPTADLMHALRAAIAAQPAPDAPVATVVKSGASRQWMSERLGGLPDGMYSLYLSSAAPIAQQAAPAQARQPLTDEQIRKICDPAAWWMQPSESFIVVARAIEAAHGISAPVAQGVES